MFQVLCMCHNSEDTIIETIDSYVSIADRIMIFIDKKTTDKTYELIMTKRYKNVNIKFINFTDFAETRNKCIKYSHNIKYEWTMFIDDSYKLIGDFNELKTFGTNVTCLGINISNENSTYKSARIFRTNSNIKYIGEVHEILDSNVHGMITNAYLYDITSSDQKKRTILRNFKDYEILKNKTDPRSLFYLANTTFALYRQGTGTLEDVINAYKKRVSINIDQEERFTCLMSMGHIMNKHDKTMAVKYYITAALAYPERAGESYLYGYLTNGSIWCLEKAYENRHIGIHRLAVDYNVYDHIVNQYFRYIKDHCLKHLLSLVHCSY